MFLKNYIHFSMLGIVSLFAVSMGLYFQQEFFPFFWVLFLCYIRILFWLLINQVRMDIRCREWEEVEGQQEEEEEGFYVEKQLIV